MAIIARWKKQGIDYWKATAYAGCSGWIGGFFFHGDYGVISRLVSEDAKLVFVLPMLFFVYAVPIYLHKKHYRSPEKERETPSKPITKEEVDIFEKNMQLAFGVQDGTSLMCFMVDVSENDDALVKFTRELNTLFGKSSHKGECGAMAFLITMIEMYESERLSYRQKEIFDKYWPVIKKTADAFSEKKDSA